MTGSNPHDLEEAGGPHASSDSRSLLPRVSAAYELWCRAKSEYLFHTSGSHFRKYVRRIGRSWSDLYRVRSSVGLQIGIVAWEQCRDCRSRDRRMPGANHSLRCSPPDREREPRPVSECSDKPRSRSDIGHVRSNACSGKVSYRSGAGWALQSALTTSTPCEGCRSGSVGLK